MNNLANDLALLGRFEEAEPLMRRTLELETILYGEEHPSTLRSVANLAELYLQLGRDAEAEPLHRQALAARVRVHGERHPRTLLSKERLAATLSNLGRFADAERHAATAAAESADESRRRASRYSGGHEHPRPGASGSRADPGEAESALRRPLAILEERKKRGEDVGETDGLARELQVHLGMTLAALGRRTEAEDLLLDALPALPPREAPTRRAFQFAVRFYEEWERLEPGQGHAARATEWRHRLEELAAQ